MAEERRGQDERRGGSGFLVAGLTRKDWLAGQAMIGILSKYGIDNQIHFLSQTAKDAYDLAEEMEKRRIELKPKK